jgi:hypothetical protein
MEDFQNATFLDLGPTQGEQLEDPWIDQCGWQRRTFSQEFWKDSSVPTSTQGQMDIFWYNGVMELVPLVFWTQHHFFLTTTLQLLCL